jgi:hypothetical protein
MSTEDAIDYGPLAALIGSWEGDKGVDVAPEPDGSEESPYYESLVFTPIGCVDNAESQVLSCLRYQQIVHRKSNGEVFHDQTGYWMWDARESVVMQSIAIPRAVCVLAGGRHADSPRAGADVRLEVVARQGDPDWGIVESPFMRDNARTIEFRHDLRVAGDTISYRETTLLDIYGRRFEHTDENALVRRP